jgi:protein-disulfide isomerase
MMSIRMSRVMVGLLVAAGLACSSAEMTPSAQTQTPAQDTVVADVAGRKITLKELDEKWEEIDPGEQARAMQLLYQNRRNVLDQMVGDILIENAAKAAGMSTEQFLEQENAKRIKEPTDADIQQFYEQNKERTQGRSFEQLKGPIGEFLKSQREQQARAQLVDELTKKGSGGAVKVTLEPPRRDVAIESHDPARGPATAPITIIEFSDFQCPYCARVTPTLDKLRAAYPDKIRLVFKDFPLPNHTQAPKAAEAAHCAGEENKYWEMHDKLFANPQALDVATLKQHATTLGLDQAKFTQCLDSGKFADAVKADMELGSKLGINSTPTLYVNGRPVIGAQPYDYFVSVIEEELARGTSK